MMTNETELEKILEKLEKQNRYCNCPELQELYKKRIMAEILEGKCDFFKGNVNLEDPRKDDEEFILRYRDTRNDFGRAVDDYQSMLRSFVERGLVQLVLRDMDLSVVKHIRRTEMETIAQENPLITYHCARCKQQIDVRYAESK